MGVLCIYICNVCINKLTDSPFVRGRWIRPKKELQKYSLCGTSPNFTSLDFRGLCAASREEEPYLERFMASKNQFTSSSTVPKSSMLSRALLETTTEVIGLKNCGSLRRHKSWDFCRLRFCGTSDSSTSLRRVHTNQPIYSALEVRRKIGI